MIFRTLARVPQIGDRISSLIPFLTSFLQKMKLFKIFKGDAAGRMLDIMCFYSKVYSESKKPSSKLYNQDTRMINSGNRLYRGQYLRNPTDRARMREKKWLQFALQAPSNAWSQPSRAKVNRTAQSKLSLMHYSFVKNIRAVPHPGLLAILGQHCLNTRGQLVGRQGFY